MLIKIKEYVSLKRGVRGIKYNVYEKIKKIMYSDRDLKYVCVYLKLDEGAWWGWIMCLIDKQYTSLAFVANLTCFDEWYDRVYFRFGKSLGTLRFTLDDKSKKL